MNTPKEPNTVILFSFLISMLVGNASCIDYKVKTEEKTGGKSAPLVTDIYTADPSAHVFRGKLYIYPSHDIESNVPDDGLGGQFRMQDYHVFSMDRVGGGVTDHGVILKLADIPWATKQLWAPDAAFKNDRYYFYFPAKDESGLFRIGVAVADSPTGPFKAQPNPINGSFSIDPCVFVDDDGKAYMYFGGLSGGQLEKWRTGKYDPDGEIPARDKPALYPRVAVMKDDMLEFEHAPVEARIVDRNGEPVLQGDRDKMFFEACWMHRYDGKYYLSYSTGYSRHIAYAIGDDPVGPFTFTGYILGPVVGWTNHHSVVAYNGKWYLFYHDSIMSGGIMHLRTMKMTELKYNADGTIVTVYIR
jgi:hypothetical protein